MSRTPADFPQDLGAERSVLGACLLSDIAIEDVSAILAPGDFILAQHQHIYRAILDAHTDGRVDMLIVLRKLKGLDVEMGDLVGLTDPTPAISNAAKHATVIVEAKMRRDLITAAGRIAGLGWGDEPSRDVGEAVESARQILAGIEMPQGKGAPDMDIDTFISTTDVSYDWLIPDFLERKDRMLVTAVEGGGKSILLAQIAVMCASGIHPWTHAEVEPRNVAIIDLENSARMVTRRLAGMKVTAGDRLDPQRLRVHCRPEGIDLTTRTDRMWLIDRCIANATELLVIGPAYRMSAGVAAKGDVGAEERTLQITRALDEVRNRCNVTLLMETHAPHGGNYGRDLRPFGSSVWLRWPEFGIGLRKDGEDGRTYSLEHWRGAREQRTWPSALQRGGKWPWSPIMPTGTYHNPRSAA